MLCSPSAMVLQALLSVLLLFAAHPLPWGVNAVDSSTSTSSAVTSASPGVTVQVLDVAFQEPWGVVYDGVSDLYVSDLGSGPSGGLMYRVRPTGNGSAEVINAFTFTFSPALSFPRGLAVDDAGAVYVADEANSRVVKFSPNGTQLQTFTASSPLLVDPIDVAVDGAFNLWVADESNNRVVQLYPNGTQGLSITTSNPLLDPTGVDVDTSGSVFIADFSNGRVLKQSSNGFALSVLYSAPFPFAPISVRLNAMGNVFVCDNGDDVVLQLSPSGALLQVLATSPPLNDPAGLTFDGEGNLYVTDSSNSRIVQFSGVNLPVASSSSSTAAFPSSSLSSSVSSSASSSTISSSMASSSIASSSMASSSVASSSIASSSVSSSPMASSSVASSSIPSSSVASSSVASSSMVSSSISSSPLASSSMASSSMSSSLPPSSSPVSSSASTSTSASSSLVPSSSTAPSDSSSPTPSTAGSLCILLYSLRGTIDYPWSVAYNLQLQYNPTPVMTSTGTAAVTLLSGLGTRTFTNKQGVALSTPLTLLTTSLTSPSNASLSLPLLLLNSTAPLNSAGLSFAVSSPVQLPGASPSALQSQVTLLALSSGVVVESGSGPLDGLGQALLSSVPGFLNRSIGPANVNTYAAIDSQCQAPITFSNGVRPPTQPSTSNGATTFTFSYTTSDGHTYAVTTNLTITASSSFAASHDQLGNLYQSVVDIRGSRVYTQLSSGMSFISTVTGKSNVSVTGAPSTDQRFYPYSLLSAGPGVYSINTAPFLDAAGLSFTISPPVPALGLSGGAVYGVVAVSITFNSTVNVPMLTESPTATNSPLLSLQQQAFSFVQ